MADPDAAEADGGRYASTLQHRLESCTARSHRRPVHRVGTLRDTRKHLGQPRPRRSRDPRGTVRGAILQTVGKLSVASVSLS